MRHLFTSLLAVLCLALASCGTVSAPHPVTSSLGKHSRIHVVKHAASDRDIDVYLRDAFARRGYQVTSGPEGQMPASTDCYATYVDRWHWDMAMYLVTLDVTLHDRKTGSIIGNGSYKNSVFHGFPDPARTCDRIVGSVLGETE